MLPSCRSSYQRLVRCMTQLHVSEPAATRLVQQRILPTRQTISKSRFTSTANPQSSLDNSHTEPSNKITAESGHQKVQKTAGAGAHSAAITKDLVGRKSGPKARDFPYRKPRRKHPNDNGEQRGKWNSDHQKPQKSGLDETTTPNRRSFSRHGDPTEGQNVEVPRRERETWQIQKAALKEKFPEGWKPLKRLSPDAVAGIKVLHAQDPVEFDTKSLARRFEVSPEAIRRILKSKWRATPAEEEERQERWFRRGVSVWSRYAEMGVKPPQKWRREGVARDPSFHVNRKEAIERRREEEAKEDAGTKLQRKLSDTIM